MNNLDFNAGLLAACAYLRKTAETYEQGLTLRREKNYESRTGNEQGWQVEAAAIRCDDARAVMLRLQAENIQWYLSK